MKAVDSFETSGIENLASRRRYSKDLNVAEDPNTTRHCPICLRVLLLCFVLVLTMLEVHNHSGF